MSPLFPSQNVCRHLKKVENHCLRPSLWTPRVSIERPIKLNIVWISLSLFDTQFEYYFLLSQVGKFAVEFDDEDEDDWGTSNGCRIMAIMYENDMVNILLTFYHSEVGR